MSYKSELEKIFSVLDKYYMKSDVLDEGGHIYLALQLLEEAIAEENMFDRAEWERGERDHWVEIKRYDNDNEG